MQPKRQAFITIFLTMVFATGFGASCDGFCPLQTTLDNRSQSTSTLQLHPNQSFLNHQGHFNSLKPLEISASPPGETRIQPVSDNLVKELNFQSLMRPRFSLNSTWIPGSGFGLSHHQLRMNVPTYPFFGPPPPMVNIGFAFTNLAPARSFSLPDELFEYSVGASWIRPINDRWMIRAMAGVALATDHQNTSHSAWQFRGGMFAVFEPNEQWQWVVGAIAIGREDLPVLPAVGVIWRPKPELKIDLTMPKPRVSMLLSESESRQQWGYVGMGIGGGTWGYQRVNQTADQLTYGDWRVVAGWESVPRPVTGERFTVGSQLNVEVGYVFSRDLEFDAGLRNISLPDALMLGINTRF